MAHRRLVIGLITALLSLIVTACAGPATESGVGLTDDDASLSSTARLRGTWHGSFFHPGSDSTSPSRADLTLQVRDDATYTLKWANRPEMTGTVAAQGKRVTLGDASGARIALVQSGDTLYGMMKDPEARGRTTMVSLAKEKVATGVGSSPAPAAGRTRRSRMCERAGGVYAHGTCQVTSVPDWRAHCEARGGTYFAGGGYCEVRAGGLRPQ